MRNSSATARILGLATRSISAFDWSYNQNLWITHPFEGAAYLPR